MSKNDTAKLLPMKVKVKRRYSSPFIPREFVHGEVMFSTRTDPNIAYGVKRIPYKVDLTTGKTEFLPRGCKDHQIIKDICNSNSQEIDILVLRDDSPDAPSTQIS